MCREADKYDLQQGENLHSSIPGLDDDGGDIGTGRISLFSVSVVVWLSMKCCCLEVEPAV